MKPRAGNDSTTAHPNTAHPTTALDAPVIFLDIFAGAGREAVTDLIRTSGAIRSFGIHHLATVGQHGWPHDPGAVHVLETPLSRAEWSKRSAPGQVAVVVTRDPRDLAVGFARSATLRHPGLSEREALVSAMGRLKDHEGFLRSWTGRSTSATELVVSFEDLAADPRSFLAALADFLGRPDLAPADTGLFGESRVAELRFEPGDAVGRWRQAFDADTAEVFEHLFPGLVVDLGLDGPHWTDWTDWSEVVLDLAGTVDLAAPRHDLFAAARNRPATTGP